jgi:hypothetical protein
VARAFDWFGLVVFASVPVYFVLQGWLAVAWHGRWRLAALVPVLAMAPAVAFSLLALAHGSNLWPILVILLAPLALGYLLLVSVTRAGVAARA